jgi:predicted ester cyclase
MSLEENKASTRRFYEEVINQKNLAATDELLADNFVAYGFPPGLPPGPAGMKIFTSLFHAAFPDGHITIDQMVAEGDTVVTRATFHGTHTGEFQGIPPTGKTVTVPALDMVRIVDGKAVELWGGPNQLILLQQLGVVPS